MNNKTIFWKIISAISLSAAVFLIYQIAGAWTNPTQNPPNGGGGNITFSSSNVGIGLTGSQLPLTVRGVRSSPATTGTVPNGVMSVESNSSSLYMGSYLASPYGFWMQSSDYGSLAAAYPIILNPLGGNVGIGTTNPGALLQVAGDSIFGNAVAATNVNMILNGVDNKAVRINFKKSGVDQWLMGSGAASENDAFEIFNASGPMNGIDALSIDKATNISTFRGGVNVATGNVGIGTTNPTSKLHILSVAGSIAPGIALMQADAPTYGYTWRREDSTGNLIAARVEAGVSSDYMTIARNSGNVGIGTTNPTKLLSLNSAAAGHYLGWEYNSGQAASRDWTLRPDTIVYGDFEISTASAQNHTMDVSRLYINPSGNVGIGTTNPGARLEVKAVADATDGIRVSHSSVPGTFYTDLGMTFLTMYRGSTSGADFVISATGSYSASAGNIILQPSRNVGIGTTAPTQKLEVNGGISLTSNVASPPNPYSGSIADWYTGNARFYSYGADAATRGGFTFTSVESDGGNALSVMTIDGSGTMTVNGALSGSGPQIVAAKGWCAALAQHAGKSYAQVINASGATSCTALCAASTWTTCVSMIDFNHGCTFDSESCTMLLGDGVCASVYPSRDYCCCSN